MDQDDDPASGRSHSPDTDASPISRRLMLQLAALTISSPAAAMDTAGQEDTFINILSIDPSDYPNVLLNVDIDTTAGKDGHLTEEDFQILEDGIRKEITSFEFGSTKSDIVFVFDDSGSMGDEIDAMKSEVSTLVSEIEEANIDSRYGLVTFRDDYEVKLDLTDDASRLQSEVSDLRASGGGDFPEDNFDAIARALEFNFRDDAQKVLIDITDALSHYRDDGSGISEYTFEEIADLLNDSGVAYIAVSPGFSDENAAKKVLAEAVDGTWIDINDADFTVILEEITELIVTAYVIGYITDLLPGETAPISVIVDDPEEGQGRIDDEVDIPTDVSDATVTSVVEPPTGVEPDQPVEMGLTVEGEGLTAEDVVVDAVAEVTPAPGIEAGEAATERADTTISEPDPGTFAVDIEFPPIETVAPAAPPGGMCYDITVDVPTADGGSLEQGWRTYTFEQVDTVATVPAHSKTTQPSATGAQLYSDLRDTAEFVCEWYASTLGSAGGHGFDFHFVSREAQDGWIELEETHSTYHPGDDGLAIDFVEDALDAAATEFDVDFGSYTTAFVVSPDRLGTPYYRGDLPPSGFTLPIGVYEVEVPLDVIADAMPISAYDTPTGRTDVAYESVGGDAWRHELGHSLGNGTRIGLPDLYHIDPEMGILTNFGDIKGWGMMGNGSERPFMSYCRMLGGDFIDRKEWLKRDYSTHFFEDTEVSLPPFTEQQLGDDATFLTSVYGEVAINVDFPSWNDPLTKPTVEFSTGNFQLQTYILEARKSGTSPIRDPRTKDRVDLSPSGNDGVALYKFGYIRVDGEAEVQRIINGESVVSVDKITPLALDFVPPQSWEPDDPTLSIDRGSGYETYEEPDNALEFEQEQSVSAGEAEVLVERDPETLVGEGFEYVERFITELIDFLGDLEDDLLPGSPGGVSLPGVDVLLETPDGRRAGVDPETGDIYEEIDGSSVTGTERRRVVSVPGGLDLDVTISTRRFREALEATDIEPPEEVPYRREHVVDKDLSLREENGLPMLDGRTRQIVDTISVEDAEPALVTGTAEVTPERLQVGSSGEFVTAYIEFDEPIDHESVVVETVTMDGIQAVHDDQYGFVENPVVKRDGETVVMVKFDRQAVVDTFDVGEHEVVVQGLVNDTTVRATGQLELFEPGNAGGGPPGR